MKKKRGHRSSTTSSTSNHSSSAGGGGASSSNNHNSSHHSSHNPNVANTSGGNSKNKSSSSGTRTTVKITRGEGPGGISNGNMNVSINMGGQPFTPQVMRELLAPGGPLAQVAARTAGSGGGGGGVGCRLDLRPVRVGDVAATWVVASDADAALAGGGSSS
mmetsp:Transcript_19442/g.39793  ORF Transcript_19442/g.39793 Transcript_19442/m.39793 type:complete len:161 (-) Transcript_19442:1833-2315(-)